MIITAISDTHSFDSVLEIPDSDILIHSGDLTNIGTKSEVLKTLTWLSSLPHKHKMFCAGNHDFFLDTHWKSKTSLGEQRHGYRPKGTEEEIKELLSQFPNLIYLNDSGVEIEGLKIWGSPMTPFFHDWAFNRMHGEEISKHWKKIPNDIDILITHGPPYGINDRTIHGQYVGCSDLLREIELRNIYLHISGHIHEGRGFSHRDGTLFVNTSSLNEYYEPYENVYTMIDTDGWVVLNGKNKI